MHNIPRWKNNVQKTAHIQQPVLTWMHTQGLFLSLKGRAVLREPPFKMVFRIQNAHSFKEAPEQTETTERSPQVCQTHTLPGSNSARRQENTSRKKNQHDESQLRTEHLKGTQQLARTNYNYCLSFTVVRTFADVLKETLEFFFFLTACNFTLTLSSQTHPPFHCWSQSCLESLHGKERRESLWASRRQASLMER